VTLKSASWQIAPSFPGWALTWAGGFFSQKSVYRRLLIERLKKNSPTISISPPLSLARTVRSPPDAHYYPYWFCRWCWRLFFCWRAALHYALVLLPPVCDQWRQFTPDEIRCLSLASRTWRTVSSFRTWLPWTYDYNLASSCCIQFGRSGWICVCSCINRQLLNHLWRWMAYHHAQRQDYKIWSGLSGCFWSINRCRCCCRNGTISCFIVLPHLA